MKHLTLKIHGQVQGVFFREETEKRAQTFGLVGYVKNLSDGAVEVVAEGEEQTLKKLLEWCKIGPRLAKVLKVEEEWEETVKNNFNDFRIIF